ncbi:MAG TPA: hypothetical protein VEX88_07795 [Glaciibacter sp.]|nr:hypothetical protein [Glaciibacter sp.]
MSSFTWAESESKVPPVAVLLPGTGYPVRAPLLFWCARILAETGWHVQAVEWKVDAEALADPRPFVERAVADAFDAAPSTSRRLIVAKSFGSFALPWARREGIPGVWLTPVLSDESVRSGLLGATPADLAIGGGADDLWMPDRVSGTDATLISVPAADHSLAIPGDWRRSIEVQSEIFSRIAQHVGQLI